MHHAVKQARKSGNDGVLVWWCDGSAFLTNEIDPLPATPAPRRDRDRDRDLAPKEDAWNDDDDGDDGDDIDVKTSLSSL